MNARHSLAALALAATLGLTACGGNTDTSSEALPSIPPVTTATEEPAATEEATPPTPVTPTPATTDDGGERSKRGNLIAALGDTGTVSSYEGVEEASFTVKDISPGVCTEPYQSPAENGNMVFVTMDIMTSPDLAKSISPQFSASSYDWTFISATGTTFNGDLATIATYSCIPEASVIPGSIGPGESVTGIIVLDVPEASGTLVYSPSYGAGFEYNF